MSRTVAAVMAEGMAQATGELGGCVCTLGGSTVAALQAVSSMSAPNVLTMMRGGPVERRFRVNPTAFGAGVGARS
jgi:hypothetical protein